MTKCARCGKAIGMFNMIEQRDLDGKKVFVCTDCKILYT